MEADEVRQTAMKLYAQFDIWLATSAMRRRDKRALTEAEDNLSSLLQTCLRDKLRQKRLQFKMWTMSNNVLTSTALAYTEASVLHNFLPTSM